MGTHNKLASEPTSKNKPKNISETVPYYYDGSVGKLDDMDRYRPV